MPKVKHSASGPYLGFGLQTVRLTVRLLTEKPNSWVYVEEDDDVSVRYSDGSLLLEQTKSALKQNPVADWAKDLWKCLFNWLENPPSSRHEKESIQYCLYVAPRHTGGFVSKMHSARTDDEVGSLVAAIKSTVNPARKKTEAYKFAARFLDATASEQAALIKNFQLVCDSDPLEPVRVLYRHSVRPELLDEICSFAMGDAKRQTDEMLRRDEPAGLEAGVFQSRIRTYVQRINLPEFFSFNPPPESTSVVAAFSGRPVFVKQLELIDASEEQRLVAVSDYLRASADKTDWAAKGILLPDALDQWEDKLVRRRNAAHDKLAALHSGLEPTKLGAAVYAECRSMEAQLDSKSVPSHFTHGCLNDLADRMKLGWHPDYQKLLDKV